MVDVLAPEPAMPPGPIATVTGEAWPGVKYFTTTRHGGVSGGGYASLNLGLHTGDDPEHVRANRVRLRALLPAPPVWLDQVHGASVLDADVHVLGPSGEPAVADAAVTTARHTVLAIMTADCLPVVVASVDGKALGAAHAGWRGLQAGVLEAMMAALERKHPAAPAWRAWIGPAIGQDGFEVGADVYAAFVGRDHPAAADAADCFRAGENPGKWMADLPGLARRRLHLAGVRDVALSGYCTVRHKHDFYSYRRDPRAGRMATLAWLTDCQ